MNAVHTRLGGMDGALAAMVRWVWTVVIVVCCCLAAGGCALNPRQLHTDRLDTTNRRADPTPCATAAPTGATAVADIFAAADPRVFAGGDGILATRLSDGRTLVITADNFADASGGLVQPTIGPGTYMRHNAAFLVVGGCLYSAAAGELLPTTYSGPTNALEFFWPTALFETSATTFTLFADIMTTPSPTTFNNFEFSRLGVARYSIRVVGATVSAVREPDLPVDATGITWGAGGGLDQAGRALIYGSRPGSIAWDIFAARTLDPLSNPATWEYATGKGWRIGAMPTAIATNCSDAVGPLSGDPYLFATKLGRAIGTDVALFTLNPDTGRITSTEVVAQAPTTDEVWAYNPQFYPISDQKAALLINHNSVSPNQHERSAYSPSAIADVGMAEPHPVTP